MPALLWDTARCRERQSKRASKREKETEGEIDRQIRERERESEAKQGEVITRGSTRGLEGSEQGRE